MKRAIALLMLAGALAVAPRMAQAAPTVYQFSNFWPDGSPVDVSGQMSLEVSESSPGTIVFLIKNGSGGTGSRISTIYWDDALDVLTNMTIGSASGTVAFAPLSTPADLPQGNNIGFTYDHKVDRTGGAANGIDPGESLNVLFDGTLSNVLSALDGGNLRVGIHVISIDGSPSTNSSDSYVNNLSPVPEPGSMALLGTGVLGLVGRLRRRRATL